MVSAASTWQNSYEFQQNHCMFMTRRFSVFALYSSYRVFVPHVKCILLLWGCLYTQVAEVLFLVWDVCMSWQVNGSCWVLLTLSCLMSSVRMSQLHIIMNLIMGAFISSLTETKVFTQWNNPYITHVVYTSLFSVGQSLHDPYGIF